MIVGRNFYDFAMGHTHSPLSDQQKEMLDFGKKWWKNAGERENDIMSTFGMNSTQYFQKLHALKDHPEAVAYAPDVVRRMNRVIEARNGGY